MHAKKNISSADSDYFFRAEGWGFKKKIFLSTRAGIMFSEIILKVKNALSSIRVGIYKEEEIEWEWWNFFLYDCTLTNEALCTNFFHTIEDDKEWIEICVLKNERICIERAFKLSYHSIFRDFFDPTLLRAL